MSGNSGFGAFTLDLFKFYLVGYATVALILSAPCALLAVVRLATPTARVVFGLAAVYGVGSAIMMIVAWLKVLGRTLGAARWCRIALAAALPGGVLISVAGLALIGASRGGGYISGAIWDVVGVASIGLALVNFVAVLRVLFFQDLDVLLWSHHAVELAEHDTVGFMEQEVELDLVAEDKAVVREA